MSTISNPFLCPLPRQNNALWRQSHLHHQCHDHHYHHHLVQPQRLLEIITPICPHHHEIRLICVLVLKSSSNTGCGSPLLNSALGDFDHSDRSAIEGQSVFRLHLYLQHYSCFIGVRQSKSPSRCKSWLKVEIIADNWRCCIHILEGEHQKRLFLPDFYRDYRWEFETLYGSGKGGWWASPTGAAWSLDCVLVDHPGGLRRAINELLQSKAIWSKWASSHQSGHPTTIQENIWGSKWTSTHPDDHVPTKAIWSKWALLVPNGHLPIQVNTKQRNTMCRSMGAWGGVTGIPCAGEAGGTDNQG